MRLGRAFGIPLRLNPLLLPLAALAAWIGEGTQLLVMAACVFLHELAHIAVARLLHVRVLELELMPLGGAARLDGVWMLRPGQLAAVALAGPCANLLLLSGSVALNSLGLLDNRATAAFVQVNLVILLFNLLPALPLDGGRALCGLLSYSMRPGRAASVGIWLGRALALGLIGAAIVTGIEGRFNATLAMAGIYLLTSGGRERVKADSASVGSLIERGHELDLEGVLPLTWLAVSEKSSVRAAATRIYPRRAHMLAVFDGDMGFSGYVTERELIRALMADGEQAIGDFISTRSRGGRESPARRGA